MILKWAKYGQYGLHSKSLCCNSRKNATLKKPVFQNGFRLPNGVFYGQLSFGGS